MGLTFQADKKAGICIEKVVLSDPSGNETKKEDAHLYVLGEVKDDVKPEKPTGPKPPKPTPKPKPKPTKPKCRRLRCPLPRRKGCTRGRPGKDKNGCPTC